MDLDPKGVLHVRLQGHDTHTWSLTSKCGYDLRKQCQVSENTKRIETCAT